MPTTRELLEAQSFERRRLLAAFVSGETSAEHASRQSRYVVAGLALAALLVAGAAVLRVL